jgi:hypothetical protein
VIDVPPVVLKKKNVLSAPPAPSSEPPKAAQPVKARKKRRRKPRPEELLQADQSRFHRLYKDTVERFVETQKQLSRIR